MRNLLELHGRAMEGFGRRVGAVCRRWHQPTPCREWDVRDLVNHLVVEQLWVPSLLAGKTVAEVGGRFDGDQLGKDPKAAWDAASEAALAAFAAPGALQRSVHLSYGEAPASSYCWEMTTDLLVHTWDLARGIGGNEELDPELVAVVYDRSAPHAATLHESGLFDPPVEVPPGADLQVRLLALFGRRSAPAPA